ncbi:MAG TPA: dihydroorotase [Methanoregula sp.]|nr:dihydroorotase [Methanoregula sp.]
METAPPFVLRNVTLPSSRVADITMEKGKVVHVGSSAASLPGTECSGCIVLPAAVDMHVHMRGGAQAHKEDWLSGSRSAIAGGVTVVVDQPNTVPPIASPGVFHLRVQDAKDHSWCHFAVNSAVSAEIPFDAMWEAGAMAFGETFYAPSSYGEAIGDEALSLSLSRIQALGGIATIHAEQISPGPDTGMESHDARRSVAGEVRAVEAVRRLNSERCRLHFCHLSSAESIGAASGSVEVTPHHLFLSRENFPETDAHGKVNPPVRSEKVRRALAACWDRIDVIASDHAPHTGAEKDREFSDAPPGVPGIETMVPLLLARVIEGKVSLASVIEKTSLSPSAILGIPRAGFSPGDRADFAIYPKKSCRICADMLHSRCGWTPFEGFDAVFPETVVMYGEVVYRGGEFFRGSPSWFPGRGFVRR